MAKPKGFGVAGKPAAAAPQQKLGPVAMLIISMLAKYAAQWVVDWLISLFSGIDSDTEETGRPPTGDDVRRMVDRAIDETPRRHIRKRGLLRLMHHRADKIAAKSLSKLDIEELKGNMPPRSEK